MSHDIFRDPVHNYIIVNGKEKFLIDTEPIQRLRYLKQTPSASFVYLGANHTRFEHSLGVMHVTRKIMNVLERESQKIIRRNNIEIEKEAQVARLAALLHDVGHGPFSHTFEEFLKARGVNIEKFNHEKITRLIIENRLRDDIKNTFGYDDSDIDKISGMAIGEIISPFSPLVADQIDADKLDFILRDSYHTGAYEYGRIDLDRIIKNFRIVEYKGIPTIAIKNRASYALEGFFISRYQMYKAVYYHRTARSFDLMFAKLMSLAADEIDFLSYFDKNISFDKLRNSDELDEFLDKFLYYNDYSLISKIKELNDNRCHEILQKITKRDHYRYVFGRTVPVTDPLFARVMKNPTIKEDLENEIKEEANVDNRVIVDIPHPIKTIKPEKIYITDEEEKEIWKFPEFLKRSDLDLTKLIHKEHIEEFVVLNVFTDARDKEIREKIKQAAERVLGSAPPGLHM